MMSASAFVFIGVIWLSNGMVQPPLIKAERNREACIQEVVKFEKTLEFAKEVSGPGFAPTYYARCIFVINTSESKPANLK